MLRHLRKTVAKSAPLQ